MQVTYTKSISSIISNEETIIREQNQNNQRDKFYFEIYFILLDIEKYEL